MNAVLGALLAPLVLLIPGFVLVVVYRRNRHGTDPSDTRFVAASLIASMFPHLALLWWTLPLARNFERGPAYVSPGEVAAWLAVLAFVVPAILGYTLSSLIEMPAVEHLLAVVGWSREARTPSAWEWSLTPVRPGWVLVSYCDGRFAGGKFGTDSFASLDPDRRDLFISEPYVILPDRTFGPPVESSQGLWVSGSEIRSVEFYEGS